MKHSCLVYVGKLFSSIKRFGAERSEGPNRVARGKFNNILSTCFTREIKLLCCASLIFYYPSAFIYPLIKIISIYLDWRNFVMAGFVNWDPQGNLPVFQSQVRV